MQRGFSTHERPGPPQDLEQAVKAADEYCAGTGVPCMVVDHMGLLVHSARVDPRQQAVCDIAASIYAESGGHGSDGSDPCTRSHLYGCYQSERFGGQYVYYCPMGLTHWTSPIYSEGVVVGALVGGPVHMTEPDDFLMEEIAQKNRVQADALPVLRRHLEDVPVVTPDRVNSLSGLLYRVARSLSDRTFEVLDVRRGSGTLQAELWDQLNQLKTVSSLREPEAYPLAKEGELLERIETGDKAGAQRVLNEILGHIFFSSGGSFDVIRSRVLELVVLLSRAAIKGGADAQQIFGLNYAYLGRIHTFRNEEELTYWLSGIMARFTDQVFNLENVKHADVIYRAVDYIRKHSMNRLTLEETASHVYLSPAYFSRVFKQEMGENFNVYVNKVRVEAAKKLLLNDSIPLVEISTLVGFEGQSYFSKVFKKLTGVTPGKFRESRGRIRSLDIRKKGTA